MAIHPYFGQSVVLTTKHDKLRLIKPAFEELIGCEIIEVNLDTDTLGTFSGEIERVGSARDTAIQKARLGMRELGIPIGLASEGSVGPDPLIPFLNSDIEHLVLVDDQRNIIITEKFRSLDISVVSAKVSATDDLTDLIKKADFPSHRLIVRPNTVEKRDCIKGVGSLEELMEAIRRSSLTSPDGLVVVESDLRAMHSPTRQRNIEQAANALAHRVKHLCLSCNSPGWGRVGYEKGVCCSECGLLNPEALRQEILGCVSCDYQKLGQLIASELDPATCQWCNP